MIFMWRAPRQGSFAAVLFAFVLFQLPPLYADSFTDAEQQGENAFQAGNYEAAKAFFLEASKSPDKENAKIARGNLGMCFHTSGDYDQAIIWYERALEFGKDYLFALEGLALTCFADKKNYEKGHQYALRAEGLFSAQPEVYYNLACYSGYTGNAASALKYIDAALYYGFEDFDLLSSDADLAAVQTLDPYKTFYKNVKSARSAISFFTSAEGQSGNGDYLNALALYQQAIDSCRTALGKDSLTESRFLSQMGIAYRFLRKYQQVLDAEKQAMAIQQKWFGKPHPQTALSMIRVGDAFYYLTQYNEAINSYSEAASLQTETLGGKAAELFYTYTSIGQTYEAMSDSAHAIEFYKKALMFVDTSSKQGLIAKAQVETMLGNALWAGSEYEDAIAAFKDALSSQIAELGPEDPEVARTYVSLGSSFISLGDFENADDCFNEALKIQLKAFGANNLETINTYEYMGDLLCAKSEFDKALARYSQDLEAIKKLSGESSVQAAQCYQRLGSVLYSLGQYDKAAASYEKSRVIWAKAQGEDYFEVARCLLGLGAIHYTKGLYDEAINAYSEALKIQLLSYGENNIDIAKNYLGLGLSFYSKGEYTKAISYYEKAAAIQKRLLGEYSPDLSRSYMNLSAAYSSLGDTGNAMVYINKCLLIQENVLGLQHLDVAASYKMMAIISNDMGDVPTAIGFSQKALDIEIKILGHDHQQVAETVNNLGTEYYKEGSYDKAIQMYQDALSIKEKVFGKDNPQLALDYLNIGEAYDKKNEPGRALEMLLKAQALAQKSPDRQLGVNISKNLGALYYEQKKYTEAKKALQSGMDLVEKARTNVGAGKAALMSQFLGVYYSYLMASAAQNNMDDAFKAAESLKARGYLDRLSLAGALSVTGVSEKDRKKMLELNDEIEQLANWQTGEIAKPENLQDKKTLITVTNKLKTLETDFDKLDKSLMSIPSYRELRLPEIVTLKDAQQLLSPNQAFIDYILYDTESGYIACCLVIKRDSVSVIGLDSSFDYITAVSSLRDAITAGDKKSRDVLGGQLYAMLVKPLESKLAGIKQLIIVPDNVLAILPFDALRKDSNSPYLCQNYEISLTPSVSVLKMTDKRKYGKRVGEWLGFGGISYAGDTVPENNAERGIAVVDAATEKTKAYYAAQGQEAYFNANAYEWNDLPGTKTEVEKIANDVFGGTGVSLMLGAEASETTVKKLSASGALSQKRIVHFACHAFFDIDYPEYSALVLSEAGKTDGGSPGETGYLTVEDVALLKFNADLVTLSACETGKGTGFYGDGLIGFSRSLLVAGANRVELTLWEIDDAATRDFMIRWYTLIKKEGMDYLAASTQVKREFIKSGKYSDPVYWSGFVLYGR
jgi:tetratricopeptide (TPR) repeat protein